MKTTFTLGEVFKIGWENTKKHLLFLAVSTLIYGVVYILLSGMGNKESFSALSIVAGLVSLMFQIGLWKIALLINSGGTPTAHDFVTDFDTFLRVFLVGLMVGVICVIGIFLLIVPGIIAALRLSMVMPLIIEKKRGSVEAIKESWNMTSGYSWNLFGFMLLSMALFLLGVLPIGLGLLVVIPLLTITQAVIYRKISGAETAIPSVLVTNPPVVTGN